MSWDGTEGILRFYMFGEDSASAYVLYHQTSTVLEFLDERQTKVQRFRQGVRVTINVDFRLRNIHEVWNV